MSASRAPSRSRVTTAALLAGAISCVLLAALVVGACRRAPPAPAAPATNTPPRVAAPRIAALAPAIAMLVSELGLRDALVARHAYDAFADQSLPTAGDQSGIDYEALLRSAPTHVLLQWGSRELPEPLVRTVRERSWTLKSFALLTLDDIPRAADELATMLAPSVDARRARDLHERFARAFARRDAIDPARVGRVLLLYSTDPPVALGPGSWHHQLLERLGARPAIVEGSASMSLHAEDVLRLAPDAIVLVRPRSAQAPPKAPPGAPSSQDSAVSREARLALLGPLAKLDLPAARSGRVLLLDDPAALTPGPNLIALADQLAETLIAWSVESPLGVGPAPTPTAAPSPAPAPSPVPLPSAR
jgi:ABC-type hemin transport system substrate-binding protein